MDRQSLTGLFLIGAILFAFTWYNSTQQQKIQQQQMAVADSLAAIALSDTVIIEPSMEPSANALGALERAEAERREHLGESLFAASAGKEQFYTVDNELMSITFSNKGGRIAGVILKDYKRYNGEPLSMFEQATSRFNLEFFLNRGFGTYRINTSDFFFTPVDTAKVEVKDGAYEYVMRLAIDSARYLDYVYTIQPDNYEVALNVRFGGLKDVMSRNQSEILIDWGNVSYQNEKGFENENNYTTVAYKYPNEQSVEKLGMSTDKKSEQVDTKVEWVAFKQQFFSSILTAKNNFSYAQLSYDTFEPKSNFIKKFSARMAMEYTPEVEDYEMDFYFGPNKFSTLKTYDRSFEKLVPLGGWIVGWVNRLIVIPVFDILGKYISNYGIIILLLTIFIKLLISPLTYKSYLSTAKMRLLKPEMEAINQKYPDQKDAMKKQQATMELYRSAGVNPMGGCLPMLIQFPILIAMFRFFPASIELRGEQFLWADDLSSYDSILNLPFDIPFYGSHVSLFTLLMAAALYISSRISYAQTAQAGPQMAGMKFMMLYMMPLMMVLWFNNYSSGLSYYYFLSSLLTIGQTYAFRYAVSDEKLHAVMKAHAAKPRKKKSGWQQRYEEMLKEQQRQQQQRRR